MIEQGHLLHSYCIKANVESVASCVSGLCLLSNVPCIRTYSVSLELSAAYIIVILVFILVSRLVPGSDSLAPAVGCC